MTRLEIDRAPTAHTDLQTETHAPGQRDMPIEKTLIGNDVPITAEFIDPDSGDLVDPDDTGSDGEGDATITITGPDDTELISAVEMTRNAAGDFEYVWDTSTDASGAGTYEIEVSAELSSETKLGRDTIELEA